MVFLKVCGMVADSSLGLWISTAALFLVFGFHSYITSGLDAFEDGLNMPDARITGYTPEELNLWYDSIGVEGCKIYVQGANFDFFPIMVTYPLFLGSFLVKFTRTAQLSESLVYLPFVTVLFDIIETYIQREGCIVYPEKLDDERIILASNACRMKWVLLIASMLLILGLYVREKMSSKKDETKSEGSTKSD